MANTQATDLSPLHSNAASSSDSSASTPLFEIVGVYSRLVIEKVYLNGLHALRRLELRNPSPHHIIVKLRSNLGSQIAFQLKNENLLDDEPTSRASSIAGHSIAATPIVPLRSPSGFDSSQSSSAITLDDSSAPPLTSSPKPTSTPVPHHSLNLATNTVAAAATGSFSGHFNQLFNFVNHIDEIALAPGQSCRIILAFLPDARWSARRTAAFGGDVGHGGNGAAEGTDEGADGVSPEAASRMAERVDEDETHNTFDVNGLLFFLGYIVDNDVEKVSDGLLNSVSRSLLEGRGLGLGVGDGTRDAVLLDGSKLSPAARLDAFEAVMASEPRVDQQLTIKFRSTVCRTVLWTDVGETGINFDDCVVGGTFFKDFTIWNRSEIELYWLLNTVDLANTEHEDWLKFTNYDTGELLDNQPILSYSYRRVRVTFKPKEFGEFNYDLQVENANDASNVELTRIHAVVRYVPREESLIVSSGSVLDFGDCCAGVWRHQELVLKNISEEVVEVHFSVENAEILFYIKSGFEVNADNGLYGELATQTTIFQNHLSNSTGTMSTNTLTSMSEASALESDVSSRASSPIPLRIKDTETLNSPASFELNDFATLMKAAASSKVGTHVASNDESDSEDGEAVQFNRRPMYQKQAATNKMESMTRIEDLVLKPGTERIVQVSYRPEKDHSAGDFKAGQLVRRNFRIHLSYSRLGSNTGKERKMIQCKARSCTSFVEVSPKELNFGDTDVGTLKSLPIHIANRSELAARVELQFTSKVLNCNRGEIFIPPKQSLEVKLDMYPRKVNPEYRKQITVVNMQNRDNDQIIEVRSTNIDKNRVTFHSLFYRILTTTGANFIDFGSIVLNSPAVRTFTIDNISEHKLILEITSSMPEDIIIYARKKHDVGLLRTNSELSNEHPEITDDRFAALGLAIEDRSEELIETAGDSRLPFKQSSLDTTASLTVAALIAPSVFGDFTRHHYSRDKLKTRVERTSTGTAYLDLAVPNMNDGPRRKPNIARTLPALRAAKSGKLAGDKMIKNGSGVKNVVTTSVDDDSVRSNRSNSNLSNFSISAARMADLTRRRSPGSDSADTVSVESERRPLLDIDKGAVPRGISAARGKSRKIADWSYVSTQVRGSFEALITALEQNTTTTAPLFPKPSMEDKYVRQKLVLRRELNALIESQILVPISRVEVAPRSEEDVVVIFTPNGQTKQHIQGIPRKHDARIFLRLVEFDRTIEQTQFESLLEVDETRIPVRELLVRSSLCRSIMDLGQKNINFGLFEKNERRAKSIIVQNRSEAPLLYHIRKSGSIASGDILLESGKYGVVRGYAKKEVEFVFEPSLPGHFAEKLVVENIQDKENDQLLIVKASIRKPSKFFIKSLTMEFGACLINQQCTRLEKVVITNTSKQARTFEVSFDSQVMRFGWCLGELNFIIEEEDSGSLTKEAEEEIEHLEQKVKIAKTKRDNDKVLKYEKKLASLRQGTVSEQREDGGEDGKEKRNNQPTDVSLLVPFNDSSLSNVLSPELADVSTNGLLPAFGAIESLESLEDTMLVPGKLTTLNNVAESKNSSESTSQGKPTTLSVSKDTLKYKRTSNSISFSLDARATKTISVSFKPTFKPPDSFAIDQDHNMPTKEIVTGSLLVHEHKNTDELKKIVFTAEVCYRELEGESNMQASDVETPLNEPGFDGRSQDIITIHPPAIDYQARLAEARNRQMTGDVVQPIAIERPDLDVGRVELKRRTEFYLKLINRNMMDVGYQFVVPKEESFFELPHRIGVLSPNEVRQIPFNIHSSKVGSQLHYFIVRDLQTGAEIRYTLRCLAHYRQYLRFPELGDDNQNQLDLGYCYVDSGSKFSQVKFLTVENLTDQDLYITCQSNLSQVCIFVDENCERGQVEPSLLERKSMMKVWVALRPNLLGGLLATPRRIGSQAGNASSSINATSTDPSVAANLDLLTPSSDECRRLVGGIKFSVFAKEEVSSIQANQTSRVTEGELVQMISQTVRFTALIGQANLVVSDRIIQLGVTKSRSQTFHGSFTVTNMSGRLPLNYAVKCSSRNIVLEPTEGTLEGWNLVESADSTSPLAGKDYFQKSRARAQVSFKVIPSDYGFFNEKIIVTNKNNSTQVFEVEVRLFVDGGHLKCNTSLPNIGESSSDDIRPPEGEGFSELERHYKDIYRLPAVKWDDIYVLVPSQEIPAQDSYLSIKNGENGKAVEPWRITILPELLDADADFVRYIELENTTSERMRLIPQSNLNLTTSWFADELQVDDSEILSSDEHDTVFASRGYLFELAPSHRVTLRIECPRPPGFDDDQYSQIVNGEKISVHGSLLLKDVLTNRILRMFDLEAWFCSSIATLDITSVDVGKVGYSNSWAEVRFLFNLRNLSQIPLQCRIQSPVSIRLLNMESGEVEKDGTLIFKQHVGASDNQTIEAVLKPRRIIDFTPGPRQFTIEIINQLNPNNRMTLNVTAHLTIFELRFDRLTNGELILPALSHPLPTPNQSCHNWFTIVNTTDTEIRFEIGVELAAEFSNLIKIDVLSRFSNSPLKSGFTLSPNGNMEARIQARPTETSRLPRDLTDLQGVHFGKLWVDTKGANRGGGGQMMGEIIPIRGVITEVPIYSLSERRLEFKNVVYSSENEDGDREESNIMLDSQPQDVPATLIPQFQTVLINNLSGKLPLHFKATVEIPIEFRGQQLIKLSPLDDEGRGTIEPSGRLALQIRILDPKPGTSGDFKLHVQDVDSFSGGKQTVHINLVEDRRNSRKLTRKALSREPSDYVQDSHNADLTSISRRKSPSIAVFQQTLSVPPVIVLRNCKRIGDPNDFGECFELDFGQQDLGPLNVAKKISLENPTSEPISYRIKTVSDADKAWLKLSRTDGTLEPSFTTSEANSITLSLVTSIRNVYSTYLIIENIDNPADTKTIRVMMEVVARQNLKRGQAPSISDNNRVFEVYVNGIDTSQTWIEMLNLFYGSEYTARSIVIYNRDSVRLEFTLWSKLADDDATEVLFSTSRMSTKLFKSLTVDAGSHVRVYIRFRPEPSPGVQQALERDQGRDPDAMEEKIVEIHVNCRLVKDYEQTVLLKAECRVPAFRVQYAETQALMGTIKRRNDAGPEEDEWLIDFPENARPLYISNLLNDALEYEIVNDTTYFLLEFPSKSKSIRPGEKHEVKVMPNMEALAKQGELLRRQILITGLDISGYQEKYVQENVTVYNKKRPQENYWIPLRISFGHTSNFQLASGYRSSWAYSMLEDHVVRFLGDFNGNINAFSTTYGSNNDLVNQKIADLEFQYYYIVDQLVYYSTVKTGENFFQLANLLFGTLLGKDLFKRYSLAPLKPAADQAQSPLAKWVSLLHYYLSFFPDHPPMLETLRSLHKTLVVVADCEDNMPPALSTQPTNHGTSSFPLGK